MGLGSRSARHDTVAAQKVAVVSEDYWAFKPRARVMTVDGIAGVVTAVADGPYPGTEEYQVTLDNGLGGGSYTASQLSPVATTVAAGVHTADQDYPELGTILHDRPPIERIQYTAAQGGGNPFARTASAEPAFESGHKDAVYLRFGKWPKDEQSQNNVTGHKEDGVSVYDLDKHGHPMDPDPGYNRGHEHDEYCDEDCDLDSWNEDYGNDTREEMQGRVHRAERNRHRGQDLHSETGHLVKGEMVGFGHDGEPLLRKVKRVGDWINDRHKHIPTAEPHHLAEIHHTAASGGNSFEIRHVETDVGGTKFPRRVDTTAHHPETGEQVGNARYFPPKRKGGPISIDEVQGHVPGAASAMLNDIEARHPGSKTVFLNQVKRNNNSPDVTGNAHKYVGAPSDWDTHYPNLADTVHRGLSLRLDPWSARIVNSSAHTKDEHVAEIHKALGTSSAGTHWTEKEDAARLFAHNAVSDHRTEIPVVLHARTPDRKHIETRRDHLYRGGVFPYGHPHSSEDEVPIRKGREVAVTGISWRPDAAHPDADEHGWVHHTYDEPKHHTAAPEPPTGEPTAQEVPSACSSCGSDDLSVSGDNGRNVQATCNACNATMSSWGGQFTPELIGDPSNHPDPAPDPAGGSLAFTPPMKVMDTTDHIAATYKWRGQRMTENGYEDHEEDIEGPLYHGGRAKLGPGEHITPGRKTNPWGDEGTKSTHVYFSRDKDTATSYAHQLGNKGRLYEVEPTGDFKRDYGPQDFKTQHPLRVLREVPREEWPEWATKKQGSTQSMHELLTRFGHDHSTGEQHPDREQTTTPTKRVGFAGYVQGQDFRGSKHEFSGDDWEDEQPVGVHGAVHEFRGYTGRENGFEHWHTKGEITQIPLRGGNVYATQGTVTDRGVAAYLKDPGRKSGSGRPNYPANDRPIFVKHEDNFFTLDGHHRVAAAMVRGDSHVEGHLYDADKHGFPAPRTDDSPYNYDYGDTRTLKKYASIALPADCDQEFDDIQHELDHHDDGFCSARGGLIMQGSMFSTWHVASDDDYRMQHQPQDAEDGSPLHDVTMRGHYPADVYTHTHYYADNSDSTVHESVDALHKARGKPNKKVRIYRAMPAEHVHHGIQQGNWVTTSKSYARLHGQHHEDSKRDWPVISATVEARHLITDGNDLREYGYHGPDITQHGVAYAGGAEQKVSPRADGTVRKVQRKPKPVDTHPGFTFSHHSSPGDAEGKRNHMVVAYDPQENWAGRREHDDDGNVRMSEVEPEHEKSGLHERMAQEIDTKLNRLKKARGSLSVEASSMFLRSIVSSLDAEGRWHFTASWSDVRDKAKRLRTEGAVNITVASGDGIGGEVKGDHNVYETVLSYVPGSQKVAYWTCGCKWAAYAWGRSPAYRRFEGRMCSHALAMQFEAQARGMFGKTIEPDTQRPSWMRQRTPVVVKHQRDTGEDLTRRAVPPGNMRRTFEGSLAVQEEAAPVFAAVATALAAGEDPAEVMRSLFTLGYVRDDARVIVRTALDDKRCPNCGAQVGLNAVRCPRCGTELTEPEPAELHLGSRHVGSEEDRQKFHMDVQRTYDKVQGEEHEKHQDDATYAENYEPLKKSDLPKEHHGGWRFHSNTEAASRDHMADFMKSIGHPLGDSDNTTDPHRPPVPVTRYKHPSGIEPLHLDADGNAWARHQTSKLREDGVHTPVFSHWSGPHSAQHVIHNHRTFSQRDGQVFWRTHAERMNMQGVFPEEDHDSVNQRKMQKLRDSGWGVVSSKQDEEAEEPTHAGVVLKARDTGRILMLQRAMADNDGKPDPNAGRWEFPGGGIESRDHTSLHAAIREFEEEVGQKFPRGGALHHVWKAPGGTYHGHVVVIPEEGQVALHNGRVTVNPDDPDGETPEQAAWWEIEHARKNPALREECKKTPWKEIAAAGGAPKTAAAWDALAEFPTVPGWEPPLHSNSENPGSTGFATSQDPPEFDVPDRDVRNMELSPGFMAVLREEPEPALPSTEGDDHDEQDFFLPTSGAELYRQTNSEISPTEVSSLPNQFTGSVDDIVARFQATAGARVLNSAGGSTGSAGPSNNDIAQAAKEFLSKEAVKEFTFQEQQELITEGALDNVMARNVDKLDIVGTHYSALEEALAAQAAVSDPDELFI